MDDGVGRRIAGVSLSLAKVIAEKADDNAVTCYRVAGSYSTYSTVYITLQNAAVVMRVNINNSSSENSCY